MRPYAQEMFLRTKLAKNKKLTVGEAARALNEFKKRVRCRQTKTHSQAA